MSNKESSFSEYHNYYYAFCSHAGPVTGDIEYLLNKEPILIDLMNWLRDIRAEWATIAIQLGVSQAAIEDVPEGMHNTNKLSSILTTWRSSMTSDYTIKQLCNALTRMERSHVVKMIHADLREPEFAEKYSKQPDYEPYSQ